MKQILVNKDKYKDVTGSFQGNEVGFENIVKEYLAEIIDEPEAKVFKFCLPMQSATGSGVAPDLILIRPDYSGYIIIEVETQWHPLRGHVLPQLRKLKDCPYEFYAERMFIHIKKNNKNTKLVKDKFTSMIETCDPEFYVVSTKYNSDWDISLSKMEVGYISISPFTNDIDQNCLYIKEAQSRFKPQKLPVKWVDHFFDVRDASKSNFRVDEVISIKYKDNFFNFQIEASEKGYFLYPSGRYAINSAFNSHRLGAISELQYINNELVFFENKDED